MPIMLEDEFGDIIVKARIGLGYTVDQVAHLTSLSSRYNERLESYHEQASSEQVRILAEVLSLDPDKLINIVINGWEPSPAALPQENALVQSIFVPYGAFGENCYILTCQQTLKSAVIDPGGAVADIIHAINESNLSLDLILLTHAHGDHTAGIADLASNYHEFHVVSHPAERSKIPLIDRLPWQAANDGDQLKLGNLDILAQHTPGHTPGATCYQVDQVCFVGDTLFAGSIGRPASSDIYEKMLSGIRNKILSLPRDTIILPGHGPITTVGEEISHNPFF